MSNKRDEKKNSALLHIACAGGFALAGWLAANAVAALQHNFPLMLWAAVVGIMSMLAALWLVLIVAFELADL